MNIDGLILRLRLVSSTEPAGGVTRKGERFIRKYAARNIRVRLDLVAKSVCPPHYDAECAGNHFEVTLTAIKGAQRQTIKAVGGCGC